jgi:hypothetical protein
VLKRRPHILRRVFQLRLICLLALFFGCLPATNFEVHAAPSAETKWKAIFIVQCAKNFVWPASRVAENRFLIGIIGDNEVRAEVEHALSDQKINGKPTHVIAASATDVPNCHVVYFAGTRMASALSQAKGNAVVTIGDSDDGYIAWFTTDGGALTARGNRALMEKAGLSCTARIGSVLFKK